MEATRAHLHGDLEVGYADVLAPHQQRQTAQHAAPPAWLVKWEDRRPRLIVECFAETLGVFIYTYCGVGAAAAFFITTAGKLDGYGSLLTIGLGYGFGIVLAIVLCGPASGGHLNPCFTIAFWLFKGFPAKKMPFYIVSQIFGGFVGIITVYGVYKQQFDLISLGFEAEGAAGVAALFSPSGPAGVFALFTNPGQDLKYVFLNEFIACTFIGIVVFSVLDSSNLFVAFASAPFVIGLTYSVVIWGYAVDSAALNTARDLGGRLACAAVYGRKCFPAKYTAIASLTNLFATQVGAGIQTLLLSDSARPTINHLPDPEGPSLRAVTRDGTGTSLRAVSREQNTVDKSSA